MTEREEGKLEAVAQVLSIVESGLFRGAVTGALKGAFHDHRLKMRFMPSLTKRVAGQVMATVRDGLGIDKAKTFDPWKAHCSTCQCGEESIRRAQYGSRAGRTRTSAQSDTHDAPAVAQAEPEPDETIAYHKEVAHQAVHYLDSERAGHRRTAKELAEARKAIRLANGYIEGDNATPQQRIEWRHHPAVKAALEKP